MHIDWAKTSALAAKNYSLGRHCRGPLPGGGPFLGKPQLASYVY